MSDTAQTKLTKIMKIILLIGVGLTITTGILSFLSEGGHTETTQNDTYQNQESNPFNSD